MMRIGLLSDTHGWLDEAVFSYFETCDEVWHAGDFGCMEIVERLRGFRPLRMVYGNIDGTAVRKEAGRDLAWDCEGLKVYMTHTGGYPGHYDSRARKVLLKERPGLFVCGHSHILRVMRDPALALVHLNPGACGSHGWHKVRTVLRFTVEAGRIAALEAIELGMRSRATR